MTALDCWRKMTTLSDSEIIRRVIKKATDNGYSWPSEDEYAYYNLSYSEGQIGCVLHDGTIVLESIFSRDLARALWGDKIVMMTAVVNPKDKKRASIWRPAWEAHLQTMVIAKDPVQYLRDNS